MLHKKIIFSALLLLVIGLIGLHAQEIIPATGGNASGSGGTVTYTVGQIVYNSYAGTNGSVAQGVQQPFEIFVISGIEEGEGINLTLSAYPNPTTDYLTLKIDASAKFSSQSISYQLFDITGKLLDSRKVEGNETSIDMKNLVVAVYFLKVTSNNKEVKTFKIIKN